MISFEFPWKRENLSEIWTWPHIHILKIFGYWPEEASTKQGRQILMCFRIISIVLAIVNEISVLMSIIIKLVAGNIVNNMAAVFMFITNLAGNYKSVEIARHRKSYKRTMEILAELTNGINHPEDAALFRTNMKIMWIMFSGFETMVILNHIHWQLRPLYDTFVIGKRTLILDAWPNLMNTWTQYFLTFLLQTTGTLVLEFNITFFACLHISISHYIICHIEILRNNLERLHLTGIDKDTVELRKILNHHIKLLEICEDMKKAWDGTLIIQTALTVISFCSGVIVVTMSEDVKYMNILESEFGITLIIFSACWYSSELTFQCESIRTSAYLSEWVNGNRSQKRIIHNLMTRTMSPIKYGGFLEINLNTFINVLKATFSYSNFIAAVIIMKNNSLPT